MRSLLIVLAFAATLGCNSGPQHCIRPPSGAWVPGIAFPVGTEVRFTSGRRDILDECDLPATFAVEWSSSAPEVAVIESDGILRGVSPGKVEVIARARGGEQRFAVTVTPAIARIEILPGDTTMTVGDTLRFRAVARGTDGSALPDVIVGMRVSDSAPVSAGTGVPRVIDEAYEAGPRAPLFTTNVIRAYARRAGTSGLVIAWVIGRADTVRINAIAP